ncbi:MAG: leucine--tRNA ligase [Bacteroidetes bacterium]|jgi:leucyl-tRNA synthetase|nr:leucine--tRNA ligase [Bacteroidota bacterium]MBT5527593.1 leucine--tRNA ligase [Cytophagia bacterium]MBT3422593.1 leucine--tRNA ligase [Bacteroidota bacterium]MBT3933772.1 leucine--tRNA ligase [Bacteroidota bacterium]MBT4338678.1 leucine--tRNA ligase [Bacteroidota bacterium]
MAEYKFQQIEKNWQETWHTQKTYKVEIDKNKPKFYVLDMFPYPSGAGLHVGHPLGYIASDIYSRYKVLKGFNVLHPMGFDAFGLPAEQYAIQTGQHPAVTTDENIKRYKEQLFKIGFAYDWDREVRTSDPSYYKWTQWTFIQLFKHYYNNESQKAEPIESLVKEFSQNGTAHIQAACSEELSFTAAEWNSKSEKEQQAILMNYRLAFQAETTVNWCPELGTVLANDEVKDGLSARGGHPVVQKPMTQWLLRVSAYSERLLQGLDQVNWSDSLKEMQRNWIGKSTGASIEFQIAAAPSTSPGRQKDCEFQIEVFTTRPDTLFGSTYMVLAPEHPLVSKITTSEFKEKIEQYIEITSKRTERDRIAETKNVSGQFTGAYAFHPFTNEKMPIWIADYVLFGYGTGAIMAVPAHDSRDYAFAKHFDLPIIEVVSGGNIDQESYDAKAGTLINSDFLNGLEVADAMHVMNTKLEELAIGEFKINYRMRDAIFSRQRYWGEPFPVYYENDIPKVLEESELPLELPEVDKYLPTEDGEPPLARAENWKTAKGYQLELDTMPGFAGSSAYYLRYMDPQNDQEYFSQNAVQYWQDVDLYIGGTEHATGHLIYSRFWNKFLFDLGLSCKEEPFKKLVNQGMIQGRSNFVYRVNPEKYAEYLLWEQIKELKTGIKFHRKYKEGHREFDFFSQDAKIVLEIKQHKKLEKLESRYKEYFDQNDYNLLLIPVIRILENLDDVINKIKEMAIGQDVESYLTREHKELKPIFVSAGIKDKDLYATPLHVDVNIVENDYLNIDSFKSWRPEFKQAEFILEDGRYHCGYSIEKMSKSMHNVVNPDLIIDKYGADTFRMYEMFLGPIELHKPWNTDGIEGVSKFLKKFWNLYFNEQNEFELSEERSTDQELKVLHKIIKKVGDDIERLSFNTSVSSFMIAVNDLTKLACTKRNILEPLIVLISPFAPHIAEELWAMAGHRASVTKTQFPNFNEDYMKEDEHEYPISFNGKMRFKQSFPTQISREEVEKEILNNPQSKKWLEGKTVRKIIFVPNKIINIVVS